MSKPITIEGFEQKFAGDSDPWGTFVIRDEANKRAAIRHALGTRMAGRTLELACGNGSNSIMLARRTLRLIACDGAPSAVSLTAERLKKTPNAVVQHCKLPEGLPRKVFDRMVAAEILYYLSPSDLAKLACRVGHSLAPGGELILCHHHLHFHDAAQDPARVHDRFRWLLPFRVRPVWHYRNSRWVVERWQRSR
ncbi:class I SAM-dependent methyltransferase [Novosphingopyxis sp.]|uniref:class I SAM-dependent methyltransferase n=1 Tax=Novosphingopyxis sp. TaxID=2709690 RepID=UPI003B5CE214